MKNVLLVLMILVFSLQAHSQNIQIMIVTGGHEFDSLEFFQMFDKMENVEYEHFIQPGANRKIYKDMAEDFDLIIFNDLWQDINESEKLAYTKMAAQGKPMLFIHHSIKSYQKWPEYEEMIGGRFVMDAKKVDEEDVSFQESDVWEYCNVENYNLVTSGFRELRFFDEIYGNVRVSDEILPLLRIRHPKSMNFVAWANQYKNSQVLYIQPGYDKRTFNDENYQKLIRQSIHYLVGNIK